MSIAIGLLSLGLAIIAWPAGAVAMTASQVAQPAGWRIVTAKREA